MNKTRALLFVIGLWGGSACAILPDSGWYWNPAESGRGFNIEIQNDTVFLAGFMYDATGKQLWVIAGGPMSSDSTYTGPASITSNGQPLGGAYKAPTLIPFGTASITWTTTNTANVTINGYQLTLTRQLFGINFNSVAQPLLGTWAIIEDGTLGNWSGECLRFVGVQQIDANGPYAVGARCNNDTRLAIGKYFDGAGWVVLLDSSASYYDGFIFDFNGTNIIQGGTVHYLKNASPPTTGLPFVGNRVQGAKAAAGDDGPGIESLNPEVIASYRRMAEALNASQFEPVPMNLTVGHQMGNGNFRDRPPGSGHLF